jgi:hypothetical protein
VAGLVLLLREAQKMISHTLVSSPVVSRVVAPRDRRRDRF